MKFKKYCKRLLPGFFTVLFIGIHDLPSRAETGKPSSQQLVQLAQSSPCPGSSTVEQVRCARLSYEAADRQINQVYRQVTASVNQDQKSALVSAQQAWIKFRDENCKFETYPNRSSSGYRVFLNQCLERVTRSRTAELEAYLRER